MKGAYERKQGERDAWQSSQDEGDDQSDMPSEWEQGQVNFTTNKIHTTVIPQVMVDNNLGPDRLMVQRLWIQTIADNQTL